MYIKYFWKPILWLVLICYGLFLPSNHFPENNFFQIPHFDKFVHFSLFFVLVLLFFKPFKRIRLKQMIWAPAISIILSAVLESAQTLLSSSRSNDVYDFLANVVGIIAATIFFILFIVNKNRGKYL